MTGPSPVQLAGLPHARLTCKTCGQRFWTPAELVAHIIHVRETEKEAS